MAIGYRSVLQSQSTQGNTDYCVTVDGSSYGTANGLFASSTNVYPYNGYSFFDGSEKDLIVGNQIYDCSRMLSGSQRFNANIIFGENVRDVNAVLYGCYNFNKPVNFPDSVINASSAFYYCNKLNSEVDFGENCYVLNHVFSGCSNFNCPVTFKNAYIMHQALASCANFNSSVTIDTKHYSDGSTPEKYIYSANNLFNNCIKYNRDTDFNVAIGDLSYAFSNCRIFNSRVNIFKAENIAYMFRDAVVFNKEVTFPHSNINRYSPMGLNMAYVFQNASNYNCAVRVPNRATNICSMLENATMFGNTVYVNNKSFGMSHVRNLFKGCNNSKRKTLYCNNGRNLIGNTASNSLVGAAVTWATTTNGYYNATYNVYIYYNYTGST